MLTIHALRIAPQMKDSTEYFQPRYKAYCKAHGRTPEAMLALDTERYPGGCMCGYIVWISKEWREWESLYNRKSVSRTEEDHKDFDFWLSHQHYRG